MGYAIFDEEVDPWLIDLLQIQVSWPRIRERGVNKTH